MRLLAIISLLFWSVMAQAQSFLPNVSTFSCQHRHQALPNTLKSMAGQGRSDTIDIIHYTISLDISNLASRKIHGNCELKLVSLINNLTTIDLDLKALTVDSVKVSGVTRSFTHVGELLSIAIPGLNVNDTATVTVYYGGTPVTDPSGFGGFYMTSTYAYNIGVAFADDPHNYGRVWFPCVDNFVDRATYETYITTAIGDKAFCGGLLIDSTLTGANTVWHWKLDEDIPTYLASVAVSNYTSISYTYNGINANFPVILAVRPTDSARISQVFQKLPNAIGAYETLWGPQPFSRVGYAMVPFNGGAMEHATNIAFPASTQPSIASELLMAHELGHHWFGDWVTCETAEDMWLNEGWASYCEKIYLEAVYGKEAYTKEVRSNHADIIRLAHIRDGGYYPVSGIGHDLTYSTHVYDKGADVAHTLRGYMGDSLFFECIGSYLAAYGFNHASSQNFRDHLAQCSGINLTSFFDNWVFGTGFTHFNIDTVISRPAAVSGFSVTVEIRQLIKEASALYSNVPLDITYFGAQGQTFTQRVLMGGSCGTYTNILAFEPIYVALDINEKISDAITDKYLVVNNIGSYDFEEARMTIDAGQIADSALIRVEHHWVGPVVWNTLPATLHVSPDRYYTVDGIWPVGFVATAVFDYNGSTSTSAGYLDNGLITNTEDSLVLLYRPYGKADWVIYTDAQFNYLNNQNDKRGKVTINNLKQGDYTLAIYDASRLAQPNNPDATQCQELGTAINEVSPKQYFALYPNPTSDSFTLELKASGKLITNIDVVDLAGKVFISKVVEEFNSNSMSINTANWPAGTYIVSVTADGNKKHSQKLIITE
jgi:hypothetical protein